jgi:hypothetical protein
MNYQFRALHRLRQAFPVEQIGLMETKLGMRQSALQKTPLSGRHIVEPNHAVAHGKQPVYHVTADKARGASDENAQSILRNQSKLDQTIFVLFFATFAAVLRELGG